jgi:hypothetical protein
VVPDRTQRLGKLRGAIGLLPGGRSLRTATALEKTAGVLAKVREREGFCHLMRGIVVSLAKKWRAVKGVRGVLEAHVPPYYPGL